MTGHHPVTTRTELPMFPALNRMERRPELQPRKYDREPFWRAPITPPSREVYIPAWNWHGIHELPECDQPLTLDANGAFLGALGGVKVAHSGLSHTGPEYGPLSPREVLPGYYLVNVPHWAFSGTIVSPLGDSSRLETEDRVWVAHPTLVLLLELLEEGVLGEVSILDSWTARVTTDFRKWVAHLKEVRTELIDSIAQANTESVAEALADKYDRFKEGYSAALSMMLTGEKCQTRRPDWTHAVYAQHAASMWRKGWRWTATGRPLLAMGHVDELTVVAADLPEIMSKAKPPFRVDETGHALGAMKTKTKTEDDQPQRAASVPLVEDGDIL